MPTDTSRELPTMTCAQWILIGVQLAPILSRNIRRVVDTLSDDAEVTDADLAAAAAGSDEALSRLEAAAERQQDRLSGLPNDSTDR